MKGKILTELLKAALERDKSLRFPAKGFSMFPFIKDGDIVTVSGLQNNLPRTGDIVAFVNPRNQKLAIHRIIRKTNGAYLIAGDNSIFDGPIPKKNILGRVAKLERGEKRIFLGLGPERCLIAFFSRRRLLPFMFKIWGLAPNFIRRLVRGRYH